MGMPRPDTSPSAPIAVPRSSRLPPPQTYRGERPRLTSTSSGSRRYDPDWSFTSAVGNRVSKSKSTTRSGRTAMRPIRMSGGSEAV
jgi:hypothetical protein